MKSLHLIVALPLAIAIAVPPSQSPNPVFATADPNCDTGALQCSVDGHYVMACNPHQLWAVKQKCIKPGCCLIDEDYNFPHCACAGDKPPTSVKRGDDALARSESPAQDLSVVDEQQCSPGLQTCSPDGRNILVCNPPGHWTIDERCGPKGCCSVDQSTVLPSCICGGFNPPPSTEDEVSTAIPVERGHISSLIPRTA